MLDKDDLEALIHGIAPAVKERLDATLDPLRDRLAATQNDLVHVELRLSQLAERFDAMARTTSADRPKDGKDGKDGEDGRDGQRGEPGRDAAQIDVLDGIDATRTYHRGTFAYHRGGLVHAFRPTDPLNTCDEIEKAGWHVVVNGIAGEEEQVKDGGRVLERTTFYTSGQKSIRSLKTGAQVYRKMYKFGSTYNKGDMVTYGGSLYHCNFTTTKSPGAGPLAWSLSVRRGRGWDE